MNRFKSQKQAIIYWEPSSDNYAPILTYLVEFNTSFSQDRWYPVSMVSGQSVGPTSRSLIVLLNPYATYAFRVLSRNIVGTSDPSMPSAQRCAVDPERPSSNPRNVYALGTQPTNLVVYWNVCSLHVHAHVHVHFIWLLIAN